MLSCWQLPAFPECQTLGDLTSQRHVRQPQLDATGRKIDLSSVSYMVSMPAKIPTHARSWGQCDLGKHLQGFMGPGLQRRNEEDLMDTINQSFNKHLFNASCVANVENSGKLQIKYVKLFL